jgi:hypothetical protein
LALITLGTLFNMIARSEFDTCLPPLQFAVFEGKPIFELKEDQEGSGKGIKKMQRIGLTEAAETWI